ncbi:hypothetical protein PR048_016749 [Dryococelus australis]|uniref:Uncharacterized protein n=1 Tax=Dryococelus australis TaxID=614101 RepID=A0ABQ9H850_9NEOP|nr:hypothetical protein PR048_016749 [Dryococelus australis]
MKGRGETGEPRENPPASSGTIPSCENPELHRPGYVVTRDFIDFIAGLITHSFKLRNTACRELELLTQKAYSEKLPLLKQKSEYLKMRPFPSKGGMVHNTRMVEWWNAGAAETGRPPLELRRNKHRPHPFPFSAPGEEGGGRVGCLEDQDLRRSLPLPPPSYRGRPALRGAGVEPVSVERRRNGRARGNGRSPRKSTDQRRRPARFPRAKIQGVVAPAGSRTWPTLVGEQLTDHSVTCGPMGWHVIQLVRILSSLHRFVHRGLLKAGRECRDLSRAPRGHGAEDANHGPPPPYKRHSTLAKGFQASRPCRRARMCCPSHGESHHG